MACNFLDEINVHKTDLNSDSYTFIDFCDGPKIEYICLSCQPFFLKSIKLENEYKKVQNIFQEKQGSSTSSTNNAKLIHRCITINIILKCKFNSINL